MTELATNPATSTPTVTVEIWSDVVCPWCYIGKRRFADGLAETRRSLAESGVEVDFDVSYHPYQLDPTASPGSAEPVLDAYAKKFGGPERAGRDHRERVDDGRRVSASSSTWTARCGPTPCWRIVSSGSPASPNRRCRRTR